MDADPRTLERRGDNMSVLLNITMPKTCEVCPCNDDNWRCGATKEYFDYDDMCERRRADCPLIEVPTPHGRLILENGEEYEIDG